MIRLFALDVDGTFTDGGLYLDGRGGEMKRFDIKDGMGIVLLRDAGVETALISGRYSAATEQRAGDLKVALLFNGVPDKLAVLTKLMEERGLEPREVAYMGDDVNDVECLRMAGLALAPSDGTPEAKSAAGYVTASPGGYGAVREAAEFILRKNGRESR